MNQSSKKLIMKIVLLVTLSVGMFLYLYTPASLNPCNTSYFTPESGDPYQHYSGWVFFRNDAWHFPLGHMNNCFYPQGTSVVFTDSIPLLAIPFKALKHILPETFQYFGLWQLLCFILQGVFGLLLLAQITENTALQLIGAGLFTLCPTYLSRFFLHEALAAHWLLLWAILINVRKIQKDYSLEWLSLLTISIMVHPYLFLMAFFLYISWIITFCYQQKDLQSIKNGVFICLWIILIWYIQGGLVISPNEYSPKGNYNQTSFITTLNLLSFWDSIGFSKIVYFKTSSNLKDFFFPGIGSTILLTIGFILFLTKPLFSWKRAALIGSCLLLAVVTNGAKVSFGSFLLWDIPLSTSIIDLLNVFRWTNRFLWPGMYVALYFSMVLLYRRLQTKYIVLFLSCLLFLQIYDIAPIVHRQWKHLFKKINYAEPQAIATTQKYIIYQELPSSKSILPFQYIQSFALINRLKTNVMYISRGIEAYQIPQTSFEESIYAYDYPVATPSGMNKVYQYKHVYFYYKE